MLIDGADGRVLWGKNADEPRAIASTTKIVTAMVVLSSAALDEVVTASSAAERVGADDPLVTELELVAGERLTVEQLLYGLLLPSANDAAVALAEHVGGSVSRFAEMMEQTARRLGATRSTFTNPAGFDDPMHRSTASDLARITRAAMKDATFKRIVGTQTHQIPWAGRPEPRTLRNRNTLLGSYPGATGVKTGQTRLAGKALVASATREAESRIAVALGSTDAAADARALLDHGFLDLRRFQIATKGTPWGLVTRGAGQTFAVMPTASSSVLVPIGEPDPQVRFEPAARRIVAEVPTGPKVAVAARLVCLDLSACSARKRMTLMERLLTLIGPIAR